MSDPRDIIERVLTNVPDLEARGDRYDEADAVLRGLTAAGYAIVPVEPTEEMHEDAWLFRPSLRGKLSAHDVRKITQAAEECMRAASLARRRTADD